MRRHNDIVKNRFCISVFSRIVGENFIQRMYLYCEVFIRLSIITFLLLLLRDGHYFDETIWLHMLYIHKEAYCRIYRIDVRKGPK